MRQARRGDRVVVVVGASSGIGRAAARRFAEGGARLVLAARSRPGLEAAAADCRADGARAVLVVPTDILDEAGVQALIDATVAAYGRIDVVVHTAMVMAYGRFEDVPAAVFARVVDTGAHGSAHLARAVLPVFRRQGEGTLIMVTSLLGSIVAPLMGAYGVAKWAQLSLARVLQIETRDEPGIRVCTVAPGGVDTPIYYQGANYAGHPGRPPVPVYRPERVARAILRCADGHGRNVMVGVVNPVALLGYHLMPVLYDVLVMPLFRLIALSRGSVEATEGNVFLARPEAEAEHGRWGRHWLRPVVGGTAALGLLPLLRQARRRGRSGR